MPLSVWYWVALFLWFVLSLAIGLRANGDRNSLGGSVLLFIVLLLLGIGTFGGPVR